MRGYDLVTLTDRVFNVGALRKMIASAEEALSALARRDALLALSNPQSESLQNQHRQDDEENVQEQERENSPELFVARDYTESPATSPVRSGSSSGIQSSSSISLHRRQSSNNN